MGRKTSSKGKEKKRQRQELQAKLKVSMAACDLANKIADPMAELSAFKKYDRNGVTVNITSHQMKNMSDDDIKWAFNLTKKNMEHLYGMCPWGWKDEVKYEEMTHENCRYLVARDETGEPKAFVHFRFDVEWEHEVVYCYEIQLEESVRSKGLGKFLMQILELLAHRTNMKKVVLTAFKHNPQAMRFFTQKLGFEEDEHSPDGAYGEDDFYYILSKRIGKSDEYEHEHSEHCCH